MREIKFRVWDDTKKSWVNKFMINPIGRIEVFLTNDPNNLILSQYTELTDRYGKEIYEGDIVKYKGWTDQVIAEVIFNPHHGWLGLQDLIYADSDCEVIGNIFENPELG